MGAGSGRGRRGGGDIEQVARRWKPLFRRAPGVRGLGDVDDARVGPLVAAPAVDRKRRGDVQRAADGGEERLAERLSAARKATPQRCAPSPARRRTLTWPPLPTSRASTRRWFAKAKTGSGWPAPKGPARSSSPTRAGRGAAGGQARIDAQVVEGRGIAHGLAEASPQEGREGVEIGRA